MLEAARIDGANWIQIFAGIVLPLSVPVTITAGLMAFVNEWNNFFLALAGCKKRGNSYPSGSVILFL